MLAAIRAFAKSWVAAILMGLLIVSFAVWGIRDVFRGRISDSVIVAGSRVVSSAEYKRVFDQQKSRYEQQAGQPIPTEVAAANGLDKGVLEGMASQYAYDEYISRLGVKPSDKLLAAQIQKIPAFFDPVTGRFDKKAYQQMLAQNGLTVTAFEQSMRDQIAEQHFGTGLVGGLMTPRAYTAMAAVYGLENRDIAFLTLTPSSVPAPVNTQAFAASAVSATLSLVLPTVPSFMFLKSSVRVETTPNASTVRYLPLTATGQPARLPPDTASIASSRPSSDFASAAMAIWFTSTLKASSFTRAASASSSWS